MKSISDLYPVNLLKHERVQFKRKLCSSSIFTTADIPVDERVLDLDFNRTRDVSIEVVNRHLGRDTDRKSVV